MAATQNKGGEVPPGHWDSCFFGWSVEHRLAWRQRSSQGHPELATVMFEKEGATDSDPIYARWADGMERAVPEVVVAEFRELKKNAAGSMYLVFP